MSFNLETIKIREPDAKGSLPFLDAEVANRQTSMDWGDFWGALPDPDPVLRKTGLDWTVFEELLVDAHVFACYQSRKAGVLNSEWRINYPKGTEKVAKFLDDVVRNLDIESIVSQVLEAPFSGFSVSEVIWKLIGGKWAPVCIDQKPNRWFVFDKENRLRYLTRGNMDEGELLPEYKFLLARNFPTYDNPYGVRTLTRCFWPVTFKKGGFKYWSIFMERFGIPWLIAKVPPATPKEKRDEILSMLAAMVQSAVAVINDNESIDSLVAGSKSSSSQSGSIAVFQGMVNAANGEISKAILTQTLTTEIGDKGAYAASQSHLSVGHDPCSMEKKIVRSAFNQLFRWICELNFAGIEVFPTMSFIEEDDAKEELARRDSQLRSQGVKLKKSYYVRAYNLRDDEFDLEETAKPGTVSPDGRNPDEKDKDQRLTEHTDPDKGKKKEGPEK
ncbi:MAG: DUF935 family protein [Deltaproteobacteria bacterium]|nr:MAG: DUF935 family protein [Deltaproteobacteria bacterium]